MGLPLKAPPTSANDCDLAAMAASGDTDALGELYLRHAGGLGSLAWRLLGSRADAEDLVQDLFVGLPEGLGRYRDDGRLTAWLRRVTINLALKRMRSVRRKQEADLPESLTSAEPAPADRLQVRQAVDTLPEKLRTVVILKLVEGYSHQEIGQLLGISRGTSEVRLSRAMARLRNELGGSHV